MYVSIRVLSFLGLVLFSLIPCTSSLFSTVFDHLKKAENKGSNHSIGRTIDFVYMLNLDERPEKYEMSLKQLIPYGINPYRFSAVNGWKLSPEVINDIGIKYNPKTIKRDFSAAYYSSEFNQHPKRNVVMSDPTIGYFCASTARGTIGILVSHVSMLQDAYDSGYKTVWIMEDDIEVVKDPRLVATMVKKLDKTVGAKNWDILFTDKDMKKPDGSYNSSWSYHERPNWTPTNPKRFRIKKKVGPHFIKIGARFGTHSFVIRRSGIKKLLNFFHKYGVFLPIDLEMYLPEDIQLYTVSDDIVCQLIQAFSDNGAPRYEK